MIRLAYALANGKPATADAEDRPKAQQLVNDLYVMKHIDKDEWSRLTDLLGTPEVPAR